MAATATAPIPKLEPKPQSTAPTAAAARSASVSSWVSGLGESVASPKPEPEPKPAPKAPEPPPAPAPARAAEPPKPAEQPPKPVESTETKPEPMPRSAENWRHFVSARDEGFKKRDETIKSLEAKVKDFEAKLSSATPTIDPKEYESVKSEREKLSETLRLVAVEKHPKFQAYYDNKTNAQIDLAKRISGSEKAEAIATLLKTPDSDYRQRQIEDLMTDMTPLQQSRLGSVLNSLEDIRAEREGEIARAREDYEKALTKQQSEAKANSESAKANAERLFESTLRQFQDPKDGLAVFQSRENDEAWNKAVGERIEAAKNILFGNEKPDELVRAALAAVSVPALLENQSALLKEIETLREQNKQLQTAQPGITQRPGGLPNGQRGTSPLKATSRPMEATGSWMNILKQASEGE